MIKHRVRPLAIVALALLMPFAAASCSKKDSTGDLSVSEMSSEMQKEGMPKEQADCMAKAYKDADLSKATLEKLEKVTDLDNLDGFSDSDKAKIGQVISKAMTCIGADTTVTTAG
jgi:hypothetical protein